MGKTFNVGKSLKSKFNKSETEMSKKRSHSHGALPMLDEFKNDSLEQSDEEDDINGIWSASQLASKQAKENAKKTNAKGNANANSNAIQKRQVSRFCKKY